MKEILELTDANNQNTKIDVTRNGSFKAFFPILEETLEFDQYKVTLKDIINRPTEAFLKSLNQTIPWLIRFSENDNTKYLLYYNGHETELTNAQHSDIIKNLSTRNFNDIWAITVQKNKISLFLMRSLTTIIFAS